MCDFRQSDFRFQDERDGVIEFMKVIKRMKSFDFIEFDKHDIVRSDLAKEYIVQTRSWNELKFTHLGLIYLKSILKQ